MHEIKLIWPRNQRLCLKAFSGKATRPGKFESYGEPSIWWWCRGARRWNNTLSPICQILDDLHESDVLSAINHYHDCSINDHHDQRRSSSV